MEQGSNSHSGCNEPEHLSSAPRALWSNEREQMLSHAARLAQVGGWTLEPNSSRFRPTVHWCHLHGVEPGESTLDSLLRILHPDDRAGMLAAIQRALEENAPCVHQHRIIRPDDQRTRFIQDYGEFLYDANGKPTALCGAAQDITERIRMQDAIRDTEEHLYLALQLSKTAIWEWHTDTDQVTWSEDMASMWGLAPRLFRGTFEEIAARIHPDDLAHWRKSMQACVEDGAELKIEFRVLWPDGSSHWLATDGDAIRGANGRAIRLAGVARDITERKTSEQDLLDSQIRLEQLAYYDHLTGLANRRLLLDRLRQAIAVAERENTQIAVCYLDLDDFKPVNDQCGHEVGDILLQAVAARLVSCVRPSDTIARWGGDEFALLFADVVDRDACIQILDRILHGLNERLIKEQPQPVSASIGVTLYPQDHGDADSLLRHADHAMYLAKQCGRNNYQFFDPEKDPLGIANRERLRDIQQAINAGELRLLYQPIVNMRSDSTAAVESVEALVRWQHPRRGLLAPGEFLPAIEGSDLIRQLDHWVLREALTQQEAWIRQGLQLRLHINVSAYSLLTPDFMLEVSGFIGQHPGVRPGGIELEILETAALDDLDLVSTVIRQGTLLGLSFSLDDFGTGYSSLTYIRRLSARTLKIDQTFVRDMLNNQEDRAIVEGVIGLARAFNLAVIAEGVETLEHGCLLMRLGCDRAQGYGIARPMDAERLTEWATAYRQPALWAELTEDLAENLAPA
ncbi:putative bifunctional diguanylate cyclase/phosphodiesterase [Thiorhodovibrio frisius]|uniref:PAS domain S-box/diguanylate cyclase (GGDEF) domain-containing protein n=1 Tax=Thiorhodovibrio frisius TaxID=631362 RepID=H8YYS4_9GAMM|nr:GGDEF domain-containing phosphodiesterase [Thiorhodovibrio frisius]EIC23600.1 PAS domain S-box/diguanylate cyclase (GGDEF) domain-containing protein [Thiorhodovibrio frisius]WPL23313.1 Cyclic di-GMP phosphodiesterase Gmr [Thiorhodovibrio frisius]